VIEVRDYGVHAGQPFLVMELLQGRTLEELVVDHTPTPTEGIELAKDVLRGLAFAHQRGVLHRDIKSENVWVSWDGQRWRAKLLDFGLVKFEDDKKWGAANKLTMQGSVFGSPAYMSPEQATGQPLDARSDVYSAGIVLYELITGAWPYEAESPVEMMRMHLIDPVPPLASRRAGLAVRPELEAVVGTALAKKTAARFPSAVEMLAALEAVPSPGAWIGAPVGPPVAAPPVAAPPVAGPPAVGPTPPQGIPVVLLALLGLSTLAAVLALVAAYFFLAR
jgi:serine/threonine-protein kinase